MNKYLAASLIVVAFVVGLGAGYFISPSYTQEMGMNSSAHNTDLGKADSRYDLRFIDGMIAHHMGAIEMAKDAQKNSRRPEIRNLANNIISAQVKEVTQLYAWKKDWYNDTRKVELNQHSMNVNLGSADEKYDLRFINAMITHHSGAVDMANDALTKSTRTEILDLANAIMSDQTKEIQQMQEWRMDWYNIKSQENMS